jgi:cell division protein FtsI (penicillin-binding protein 3)
MKEPDPQRRLKWTRIRVVVVAAVLLLAAGRIMARSWEIQITRQDEYSRKAREQQLRSVQLPPSRGAILDRNGNELAISVMVPSIYANPDEVTNPARAATMLSGVLGIPEDKLLKKMQTGKSFAWLKRRVTAEVEKEVRKLDLEGIHVTFESKRFYPHKRLASHVLGFGGYDAEGLEGIELHFNRELLGPQPIITGLRDAMGRMIFSEGLSDDSQGEENRLILSIDKSIQGIAEDELEEFATLFEAKAASIVVVNPKTGEILAMANYPDFNPNLYWKFSPQERRNRAVTDRFEPGSTMKVFTMAAALDAGSVKLTDLFYCHKGEFKVDDLVIRDAHRDEWLSPVQIIQRSSNIGITKISFQTGKAKLYKMLRRFGYGDKTGVPYPGETPGFLRHYSQWYDVDFASISYGHGLGVSTVQLAMAVSAIANGGKLLKPVLVKKVVSTKGTTVNEYKPGLVRKVIETKTARILSKMMVSVTQEGGTGIEAAVDGYLVSGKTGTAQKPDTISGGYTKDKWIASFVGFVPTDDPQLAMAIIFDEPLINYYGGVVAAPVFRRVAEKSLRYLGVTPKLGAQKTSLAMKEAEEKQKSDDGKAGTGNEEGAPGGDGEILQEGAEAVAVSEAAEGAEGEEGESPDEGEGTVPPCAGDCIVVPDLTNLSVPVVLNRAREGGLKVKVVGSGRSKSQSLQPGLSVLRGTEMTVQFGSVSN